VENKETIETKEPITLIYQHTKHRNSKNESDHFNGIRDLFVGDTREISPKYLGVKNYKKCCVGNRLESGFLYLINARGTDLYKIGVSGDFNRRFKDISAASPLPLLVCCSILIRDPQTREDFLHKYYESKYFKNDWFSLDQYQFEEIVGFFKQWGF